MGHRKCPSLRLVMSPWPSIAGRLWAATGTGVQILGTRGKNLAFLPFFRALHFDFFLSQAKRWPILGGCDNSAPHVLKVKLHD